MMKKKKEGSKDDKRKFSEAILKGDMKTFEAMLTGVGDTGQPVVNPAGSDDTGTPFMQVLSSRVRAGSGLRVGLRLGLVYVTPPNPPHENGREPSR